VGCFPTLLQVRAEVWWHPAYPSMLWLTHHWSRSGDLGCARFLAPYWLLPDISIWVPSPSECCHQAPRTAPSSLCLDLWCFWVSSQIDRLDAYLLRSHVASSCKWYAYHFMCSIPMCFRGQCYATVAIGPFSLCLDSLIR
jgi:hypothetical protein